MKKTLATVVMMVLGLTMTASALPPVTADECVGVGDIEGEFYMLVSILGGEISGLPPANLIDISSGGIPDLVLAQLLAAAVCADDTVADQFETNQAAVLGFANEILALVAWAGASVDETTGAASALAEFTAVPAYVSTLQAVLTASVGAEQAQAIIWMLTDADMCETFDLTYIPDALPGLAAELTGIGTQAMANPYFALPFAMSNYFLNAFTAWMSCSSGAQATLAYLFETELLADARDYAGMLDTIKQVFDALAYTCDEVISEPDMALAFGAFSAALQGGIDVIDAIVVPTPDIITGVMKVDNGQPFSAGGDYDGDGVLNLTTWNAVKDSGGASGFIAAASGADPYYEGNPLLPAAGLIGLAALVSAIAGGGAFVLRKK